MSPHKEQLSYPWFRVHSFFVFAYQEKYLYKFYTNFNIKIKWVSYTLFPLLLLFVKALKHVGFALTNDSWLIAWYSLQPCYWLNLDCMYTTKDRFNKRKFHSHKTQWYMKNKKKYEGLSQLKKMQPHATTCKDNLVRFLFDMY